MLTTCAIWVAPLATAPVVGVAASAVVTGAIGVACAAGAASTVTASVDVAGADVVGVGAVASVTGVWGVAETVVCGVVTGLVWSWATAGAASANTLTSIAAFNMIILL